MLRQVLSSSSSSSGSPISLSDIKTHLRVVIDDEDTYIQNLVDVAQDFIERSIGLTLTVTEWYEDLPRFPGFFNNWSYQENGRTSVAIELLRNPLQSVAAITYYDGYNNPQTLASDTYEVVSYTNQPGLIIPLQPFPCTFHRDDAVTVHYFAGYTTLPQIAIHAVRLLVGHWYNHRESEGDVTTELQVGLERLLGHLDARGYMRHGVTR